MHHAFCETLEECNYRLQKELLDKQREINCLKKTLEKKEWHIQMLEGRVNGDVLTPDSPCCPPGAGSDCSLDMESSAVEADQELPDESQAVLVSSLGSVCWCGPSVSGESPPVIQVTALGLFWSPVLQR